MNNDIDTKLLRLARQWAKSITSAPENTYGQSATAAAKIILGVTSPVTMADAEWDDDEHYLAGATMSGDNEVVMMCYEEGIDCIVTNEGGFSPDSLVPNGKEYKLVEITDNPGRPETLTTAEDYKNAPVGTIVALNGSPPYLKSGKRDWSNMLDKTFSEAALAGLSCKVLRWGW